MYIFARGVIRIGRGERPNTAIPSVEAFRHCHQLCRSEAPATRRPSHAACTHTLPAVFAVSPFVFRPFLGFRLSLSSSHPRKDLGRTNAYVTS